LPPISTPPFFFLPQAKSWLALELKDHYLLLADFFAIFFLSRVMAIRGKQLRNTTYWLQIIASPVDFEDFQKPRFVDFCFGLIVVQKVQLNICSARTWTNSIRYYIYRFSVFWVLLLVFAAGTVQPDVLSLGYVAFSLWFIFRESGLYRRRNDLWRWARLYNFLLLMARVRNHMPKSPPPFFFVWS